ncbi:MAG: transglutaminaseTgpA domain-containing protein [Acidimicrobiia bacterium]
MDRHRLAVRCTLATLNVVVALGLGRLFVGAGWILPVLAATLLPHCIAALADRLRMPTALLFVISLGALVLFTGWVVAGSTTVFGFPTSRTFDASIEALRMGVNLLRVSVPPIPTSPAIFAIVVPLAWVSAMNSDFLALRAESPLGALVFPLLLLVLTAVFDRGAGSIVTAAAFAGAGAAYLAACGTDRLVRRRTWLHAPHAASRWRFAASGLTIAVIAVAASLALGPLAPGANGASVIDLRKLGNNGDNGEGDVSTDNPLVGLKGRLDQKPIVDLFTVQADRPQYWRLTALDRFNGKDWSLDAQSLTGDDASDELRRNVDPDRPLVSQVFRLQALTGRFVPAAFDPVNVQGVPGLAVAQGLHSLVRSDGANDISYRVDSRLAPETLDPAARQGATGDVPDDVRAELQLPSDFPESIRSLATQLTGNAPDRYAKAKALEDHFARSGQFRYTLETAPGTSQSVIENFVLTGRQGFCEQFAAAFAAMARAAGIPARVVVGFTPGTALPDDSGYVVRSRDAHAWAEVWVSPSVGWMPMEPTPAGSAPGQPPAGDDPANPRPSPTTTAAPTTVAPPTSAAASTTASTRTSTTVAGSTRVRVGGDHSTWWVVALVVLAVVAVLALLVVWVVRAPARRRTRRARGEPRESVHGAWVEALDVLESNGFSPRGSLTPEQIASAAPPPAGATQSTALLTLARVYTVAQFSPHPVSSEDAASAWAAVEALDAEVATRTTARDRWRARLRPRPGRRRR